MASGFALNASPQHYSRSAKTLPGQSEHFYSRNSTGHELIAAYARSRSRKAINVAPQQPTTSKNRGNPVGLPQTAHHWQRFARLSMSLLLLAALFLRVSLGHVPAAYAASGFNVSGISGNTSEAGGTATFTIRLTGAPSANV